MFSDGLKLIEGSSIINAVVSGGTSFPSIPSFGELFYRTDLTALYIYNGSWKQLAEFDEDLSAIGQLSGTTGLLRKTAANTWELDTNVYLTALDQTVTLTGDVTGSGPTVNPIATTLATVNSNVGTFGSASAIPIITVDAKGRITSVTLNSSIAANTAASLLNSRTIALSGAATGTATSFNGTSNITIPVTALNADNLNSGTVPSARLSGSYGISVTGNAGSATKLETARTISSSGDASWSVSFDGSANVSGTLTLTSIATAGTYGTSTAYPNITIDAKGRVTSISTVNLATMAFQNANNVNISGGSISGVTINSSSIGATTPAAGSFTTLSANSTSIFSNANNQLQIRGNAATNRQITFESATLSRWALRTDASDESGSNAGSNFRLVSYADDGLTQTTLLTAYRNTGKLDFSLAPTVNGTNVATVTGNIATADKWSTARTLSLTGDGTASLLVDGSANVSSALTLATVNANTGTFGSATSVPSITVNNKGLITAASSVTISIPSSQVLDFTESVQDVVGTFTSGSNGVIVTYNDGSNTLSISSNATSANTGSTIVSRNSSGDFSASSISLSNNLSLTSNTSTIDIGSTSVAGTPTLKLRSSGTIADYDSRIFSTNGTTTSGNGTLTLDAANISLNGITSVIGGLGASTGSYLLLQPSNYGTGISRLSFGSFGLNSWELATSDSVGTLGSLAIRSTSASITGDWTFNSPVTVSSPTLNSHAATKIYVDTAIDNAISGLDPKQSVRLATTENITLSGLQTIDNVLTVAGDRVLVKNQNTASENGIYVASASGWTRALDANSSAEVTYGLYTFVSAGNTNANSGWVLTTADPINLGVTSLTFSQFNGLGQVIPGAGLTKSGNQLDVVGTVGRIVANADSIDLATVGTAGTYRSVTTDAYGRVTSGTNPTTISGYGLTDATQRPASNFLSGTSAGAIRADNVRQVTNPETSIGYVAGARVRLGAVNEDNAAPFADVIDLSAWNDSSVGFINALYFAKNSQAIYHKQGFTSWSVKTLAYTDSNVASATKLATARTIASTGDATWSVSFDGSANVSSALTLATVNASPESNAFKRLTINAKGLVTATSNVVSSDITTALGFTPVNKTGDTLSGNLSISTAAGDSAITLNKVSSAGNKSRISLTTAGSNRWEIYSSAVDDNFSIDRYNDSGVFVDSPLSINRSTGVVTIPSITGTLTGNSSTSTKLATARTIASTGDATWSVSFDGSANVSSALTLATVNATSGTFGTASKIPSITVDAKGRITSITALDIDVGGSDLYYFEEAFSSTGINSTRPISSFVAASILAYDNIDVSIGPKGTGAISAQAADGTSASGNKRGERSVDWQTSRTDALMVASGASSVIVGGSNNTASGSHAIAGGTNNQATGDFSVALGNSANTKSRYGAFALSSGSFGSSGDAQSLTLVARCITTSNTVTDLTLDGLAASVNNIVTIDADSTVFFEIALVARRTDVDNESAAWKISGCIDRNSLASSTAMVGAPNVQTLAKDTSAWNVSIIADTTNGALKVSAIGENAKTIRWVAKINLVEVKG